MKKIKRQFAAFFVLVIVLLVSSCSPNKNAWTNDRLMATFLDVGQGDSILLKTDGGRVILVDAGEDDEYHSRLLPALRDHGVGKIDLFVASHYHSDHIGAAEDVFEDFEVAGLVIPDYEPKNSAKKKLLNLAKAENSDVYQLSKGDSLPTLDEALDILVLHPDENGFSDDENENSLVLMARYFDTSILLTGDIEESLAVGGHRRLRLLQTYRVGMHRIMEYLRNRTLFYNASGVHNNNVICHFGNYTEVVGD